MLDAIERWWSQHGIRHMGEIELARSLVGLGGMTSGEPHTNGQEAVGRRQPLIGILLAFDQSLHFDRTRRDVITRSLVTGASTGIGFATALRLATEGHEVHASVRSLENGRALLDASAGLALSLVVMDVDDDESVAGSLGELQADRGPVDVLVNNAGIAGGHSVEETPLADFQRVMNTNPGQPSGVSRRSFRRCGSVRRTTS